MKIIGLMQMVIQIWVKFLFCSLNTFYEEYIEWEFDFS